MFGKKKVHVTSMHYNGRYVRARARMQAQIDTFHINSEAPATRACTMFSHTLNNIILNIHDIKYPSLSEMFMLRMRLHFFSLFLHKHVRVAFKYCKVCFSLKLATFRRAI